MLHSWLGSAHIGKEKRKKNPRMNAIRISGPLFPPTFISFKYEKKLQ
jgi:hypothetical protein